MDIEEKEKQWVLMVLNSPSAFRARSVAQDIVTKAHSEDRWDALQTIQDILENVVVEAYTEGHEHACGTLQKGLWEITADTPTAQTARDMDVKRIMGE